MKKACIAHRFGPTLLAAIVVPVVLTACNDGNSSIADARAKCVGLVDQQIASVTTKLDVAEWIAASKDAPWTSPNGGGGSATVTESFCRVAGSVQPSKDSDIRFELWMPAEANWNQKFAGTASGGSNGYISYGTVNQHLGMRYASIGHDNGHRAADEAFALNAERKIDFAWRAQHVVTQVGKEITQDYYGKAPRYAYYNGCSQSGHHGIMEMWRFPGDYDGIIAGAPASDWTGTLAAEANAALAQWASPGAGVPKALLAAVGKKVIEMCDGRPGIDQVADGVLDDPRRCNFDPAVMQCGAAGADPAACLTPPQVQALRTALNGRFNSNGQLVAQPYTPDAISGIYFPSEATSPSRPQGSWSNHWRYAVFENPAYDFTTFNWNTDVDYARNKEGGTYDVTTGDFSAFANRGGKFLMYHGWADSLITPQLTLKTWERMNNQMGPARVDAFARLFMIPGMDHCGGGTGTSSFELLSALSDWVENGVAPDATITGNTTIASRPANAAAGLTARTRPLCPYPQIAKYKGSGSVDDAANFTCGRP